MPGTRSLLRVALLVLLAAARRAPAQVGQLVSPGPLTKAHAKLEGLAGCEKCHEKGKQVSAKKCLACHEPVAQRIARKSGVHRDVKEDCVTCHVEHAGRDAELRPFDAKAFDHAAATGFALTGKHAPFAKDCARCHKGRSFLAARPECAACHQDVHKGTLGANCASCHSAAVAFKETRKSFDHARAAFKLEGAHATVDCAKCHVNGVWRGLRFAGCADCHKDPHRLALGTCAGCHVTTSWKTEKIDHAKTGTPLLGRHALVPCAKCHAKPAVKVRLKPAPCAACHADVHKGAFKEDCASCHKETGFKGAPFDHGTKTRFPLTGRHAQVACASCHRNARGTATPANLKSVDFRGLKTPCASCHADVHAGKLGTACESCHGTRTFKLKEFRHPRFPELYAGRHARVPCEGCHKSAATVAARTFRALPTACASCHADPHLGQLGARCESCHTVALPDGAPKFAATLFRHSSSSFPLTGKHEALACAKCHRAEKAAFPAGSGTAVRMKGLGTECAACHKDVHLGQLGGKCESCHTTATFAVKSFRHEDAAFFRGRHGTLACEKCHKAEEAQFPAGKGRAVRFTNLAACASCHVDVHKGTLGTRCASCHGVEAAFRTASRAFHKSGPFPLEGKHLSVPCASCHLKGATKGTPLRCYDCHWVRRQDDPYRTRLGVECESCHRPVSWTAVNWDHGARTGVVLAGAHRTLPCERCHQGGVFRPAAAGQAGAMECYACHRAAFESTREPSHVTAGFPTTCVPCHRASDPDWRGAKFDHASYPLVGIHATQTCAACHKTGVYKGTPTDCASCHQADYQSSANPNHMLAGFQTRCESCHGNADPTWHQGRFTHAAFVPTGIHATQPCAACHKTGVFRGTSTDCYSCHQTDYQKSANPNHVQAGFPTACLTCHKASDATWHLGKFDHATVYPLVGVHATQACAACHKAGVFKGTPTDCASCHQADYQASKSPNHVLAGFPTRCDSCHGNADPTWHQGRFTHATFVPAGVHATQPCAACHKASVFKGTSTDCFSCHQPDYQSSANPNHVQAGFPTACLTCHKASDATWHLGKFDHATVFPLVGVHATQACASCHKAGVYKGTPTDCYSCHRPDYDKSANPSHQLAGFATRCETCHNATDATWHQGKYTHVSWALLGAHANNPCATCHKTGVFKGTSTDCASCHLPDYQRSANPNHVQVGFPTTCEVCHKRADPTWHQGTFSHATYPLVGVHATQACGACHKAGVYKGTPTDCASCHQADYQSSANPNHMLAGFSTRCDSCHGNADPTWHQGRFTHATFVPVGVHATQPCAACHRTGVFKGTSTDCYSCHQTDYQHSANPNHVQVGFPTTCLTCHRASDATWHQGTFNHAALFPLVGVHATQPCAACHKNGVYPGTPTTCIGCHLTDYQHTTNPNHAAAGFPTTCETCHRPTDATWHQGTFNHATLFPLVGVHATQPCAACHKNGVYPGTPTTCVGCHLTDYQHTTNPNHAAAGFPTTCETCHRATDATWHQGTFNHATLFPLVGVHATQPCAACHKNGVYPGTPTTCVGCHLTDYQHTTNPNHAAAGFPTTCETCHRATDASWNQGTFNHTWFPIASGRHAGNPCSACHTSPSNYAVFTCLTCHDRARTDSQHRGRAGYVYDSHACYSCHPQGRAG